MPAAVTSPYDANLATWPDARALPGLGAAPGVRVDPGEPWPVVSLRAGDRWLTLHSRHDPIREAERQLDGTDLARETALFVIGLGLGYVLDALDRRAWPGRVIAFEPDADVVHAFLSRRDWRGWLAGGRLTILVGPAFDGLDAIVASLEPLGPDPPVVTHAVVARARPDAVTRARQLAARAWSGARANQDARRRNAGRYLVNTLSNLRRLVAGGDAAALAGCAPGVPAIVVGAGPSLDANLAALRRCARRAVVVAADTAARPLLAAGIVPHLIVSIDPTEVNGRHLAELRGDAACSLVAEPSLDPAGLAAFGGRVFFGRVGRHHPWPWLESAGVTRGLLRAWGSVLTTASDVAVGLGCNPIVYAGADLAFTSGRPYARGTSFEEDWRRSEAWGARVEDLWARAIDGRQRADEPGVDGRPVCTAPHLLAFRDWLVAEAGRQRDRRFVNATGAGILVGEPIEQAAMDDILSSAPEIVRGLDNAIRATHRPQPAGTDCIASAVTALASAGLDPARPPVAEWIAFAGDQGVLPEIRRALGIDAPHRRAPRSSDDPPAATPARDEPGATPPAPPPDPFGIAAAGAGLTADRLDQALSPHDRETIAAFSRERHPQVVADVGSPLGLAGLIALHATDPGARLRLAGGTAADRTTCVALAASLGLGERVEDGDAEAASADLVVLGVSTGDESDIAAARSALDKLSARGALVLIDTVGHAKAAALHRVAYPLLATHQDLGLADQRFADHASRLAFLTRMPPGWVPDPALADLSKWDDAHRLVARRLAPLVWSALRPASARDLGCGAGHWLEALRDLGVPDVDGITPARGGEVVSSVADAVRRAPLHASSLPPSRCDVCLCLEIIQRLSPADQDQLVAACVASSDTVVFSSTPPGWSGGDPGDRPLSYWSGKFLEYGYLLDDALRPIGESVWGFPAHVMDGMVVFRKRLDPAALDPRATAAIRETQLALVRRLEDLHLQGIWWQVALMRASRAVPAMEGSAGAPAPGAPAIAVPCGNPVRLRLPAHRLAAGPDGLRVFQFRTDAARWMASHPAAPFALEEDGAPLPQFETNAEAAASPAGGWCRWRDTVVVAASDGSDPRTNGRAYDLLVAPHVAWAERQVPEDVLRHGL